MVVKTSPSHFAYPIGHSLRTFGKKKSCLGQIKSLSYPSVTLCRENAKKIFGFLCFVCRSLECSLNAKHIMNSKEILWLFWLVINVLHWDSCIINDYISTYQPFRYSALTSCERKLHVIWYCFNADKYVYLLWFSSTRNFLLIWISCIYQDYIRMIMCPLLPCSAF